jgi:alcohol dehydrogenase class IV
VTGDRPTRIVRFGAGSLAELAEVCAEAGITKPLLVASRRGAESGKGLPVVAVYDGVRPHVPVETVHEAAALVRKAEADGLVGLGGGSAVDTCKAVVAELAGSFEPLPRIVAVPTTTPAPSGRRGSASCSSQGEKAAAGTSEPARSRRSTTPS